MKIYLISQDFNTNYDTFDSAVVAAEDEMEAKRTHPSKRFPKPVEEWGDFFNDDWVPSPVFVKVTYIGEAKPCTEKGVILASFNAG